MAGTLAAYLREIAKLPRLTATKTIRSAR